MWAFWAAGCEPAQHGVAETRLVLVGSLDGVTSGRVAEDDAVADTFSFPSDPGFLIEALDRALALDVDYEVYEQNVAWSPGEATSGCAAEAALRHTQRGRQGACGSPMNWVKQERPQQRVVAIVSDIDWDDDGSRTILARPICISSTI